ncbi:MAG TPA: cadherin-like domain-containing protein, partial [Mycobacteriales bacterium]|nr:cadherin-like domain-containing protein [Mycobacteriales bacterium]
EDTAVDVRLVATDVDGDSLTYRIVAPPLHGTLLGDSPLLTYVPAANFNGTDAFGFVANDGQVDSNLAVVQIAVTAVNDAPVATPQTVRTHVGFPVLVHLTGTDVEGDKLTFRVVARPLHGWLIGRGADYLYIPFPGFRGADAFRFVANDGKLDSAPATVSIEVLRGKPVGDRDDRDDREGMRGW